MEKRKSQEIEHNKKILEEKTDNVWGWNTFAGKLRLERRAILINEHIDRYANKNKNGLKALEIGCGTGLLTERLLSLSGVRTTSFDIYDGFVLKAKKRVEDIGEIADFLVADAEDLPFLDSSIDIIFGVSILHHLKIDTALREIKRVLKPGGGFVFSEPNMLNPQIFLQKNVPVLKRLAGDSPQETAFYPFRLSKEFLKHDLVAEIMPFDFLHPKTPGGIISAVKALERFLESFILTKYISGSLLIRGWKEGS